jgi:hypothetical protein
MGEVLTGPVLTRQDGGLTAINPMMALRQLA